MTSADEILFRCSGLGYIMTEPKEDTPREKYGKAIINLAKLECEYEEIVNKTTKTALNKLLAVEKARMLASEYAKIQDQIYLSESCKTHMVDIYVSNKYNRFTEIKAKQLDKGNETEEDSITTVSRITKTFFKKNEEHIHNGYIKGTPDLYTGEDIYHAEIIRDTKSSWDIYSFHRAKAKGLNDMYKWQGTGYMALTGAKKCFIDYCLNNTPYSLVHKELHYESFNHPDSDTPAWAELQIIANHVYDRETFEKYIGIRGIQINDKNASAVYDGFVEVPLAERHFCFEFDRNEDDIKALYQRVKECREYLNKNFFKKELIAA
jgi:hypothetical protein